MDFNYLILTFSVIMFGVQFYMNDRYRMEAGAGASAVFVFNLISSAVGAVCLCLINKFDFSITPFSFFMALLSALNAVACNICTLKSLERVNISLYSLFSMLGGMLLPFVTGMIFYGEPLTLAKGICIAIICVALFLGVDFKSGRTGGEIFYVGVFFFNGMSGVLSKIHTDAAESGGLATASSAGYSLWISLISVAISIMALLILGKRAEKPSRRAILWGAGGGALNRIANYLLLIALSALPASVQYPFVTGGVIIASAIISAISDRKPSAREIGAVALSFAAVLLLVIIPI